jgi:general secretion pathway protein C
MNARHLQFLATGLTTLLLIALGLQLAWWTWQFISPTWNAPPLSSGATTATVPATLGRQLFGDREGGVTISPAATANVSGIRLKGVFAVDGRTPSAAVVNLGGRDQTVHLNQEISAGVKLVDVQPAHIVVSRGGLREQIELERAATVSAAKAAAGATPAITQFRLNVTSSSANQFSLSRQELNTVLQDPRQLNFLGRIGPAPNGGVRVEDAPSGSLSQKLGLQAGDIIANINGQPINSQGDLARVYGQFNSLSAIRAEVRRNNAPVVLNYTIQN